MRDRNNIEVFLEDFDKSYNRLRSKSMRLSQKDSEWSRQLKFLEEVDDYKSKLEDIAKRCHKSEVRESIYKEPQVPAVDISETAINRLVDRVVKTIRSSYKTEDLGVDTAIGKNDTGATVPLPQSIGMVSASDTSNIKGQSISQESYDHLQAAIEVLRSLGYEGQAGDLTNLIGDLEVI